MNYVLLVDTNNLLGKQVSKTLGFLDSWVLEMRKNKRQIRPRKRKCNKKDKTKLKPMTENSTNHHTSIIL